LSTKAGGNVMAADHDLASQLPQPPSPRGSSGRRPPKPPFDRERFVFKILAVVIGTQLLIYSLAAGVCGQRALDGRPVGQVCPGTLEQLQGGFDSTLKLLLALLGGAALSRMDR
jgi:hypothetical protein